MVIDTSVLVALWRNEPGAERLYTAIQRDPVRLISAASVLEATMVLLGERGGGSDLELNELLRELGVRTLPVTEAQLRFAREAARSFGRNRHPALLNFGDCFSYGAALESGEPLLFVGDDFSRTDVDLVSW